MSYSKYSSLFFKQEGYFVGTISFDLLLSENHTLESEVSSHPIENGANVADHVRNLPRKGSLVGLVTNFPLNALNDLVVTPLPGSFMEKVGSLGGNLLQNLAALNPLTAQLAPRPTIEAADFAQLERPQNRAANTWELFKQLRAAKQPVVISTGLEKYQDVIVTKVGAPRDKDTGDALKFSVEFTEIEFRTLSTIELATTTQPIPETGNKPKADKGKVGGKTDKPAANQPTAFEKTAWDTSTNTTSSPNVKNIQGKLVMKNADGSLTALDAAGKRVQWHVGMK